MNIGRVRGQPRRSGLSHQSIKDPTLFEMGKLEEAGRLALNVERPYSVRVF
jgi:hypothetical protein